MTEAAALSLWPLPGVPMAHEGDDVAAMVLDGLGLAGLALQAGDVVVVAQKVISKAEGRLIALSSVTPSARAIEMAEAIHKDPRLIELILSESVNVLRVRAGLIIVEHRLGFVMANAGVDQSNIGGEGGEHALLLPVDPDASAAALRRSLRERTGVDVAVLVIDSVGRAWRHGTVGTTLGVSGMPGLLDLRGQPDLFGRQLQTSELGVADEVAAAASLVMGQAGEGRPIVLARGVPYERREGSIKELIRPREMDLFR
jgi:coenzyme F420-0:L-glutamate ligase / coenzyme F420-1:gamma-L-glutamate ligase